MQVIARLQDLAHCASITYMIRHYVARRAKVIFDHPHDAEDSMSRLHPRRDRSPSVEYLRPMTRPSGNDLSGELLLVAIVEMAPGRAAAGQQYEDTVLGLPDRHGRSVERRMRSMDLANEVHIIRFRSRTGYESFMTDRLGSIIATGSATPRPPRGCLRYVSC